MKYKILSLDGGGAWSLIQARVLLDIYGDLRGHELLKKFDMAIANSGGSLVLACLCNDMKISEIVSTLLNKDQRKQVFSALTFWEKLSWRNIASLTNVLGPRYSAERKLKGLKKVLSEADHLFKEKKIPKPIVETPLNEIPGIIQKPSLQLLIVGFDYFRRRVSFFRSNSKSSTDVFSKYYQVTLGHAIHSSSNAPVNYFDAPAQVNINLLQGNDARTSWYWDGAVSGFNNPVLAGLVEAITNNSTLPAAPEYCILSIGTSTGSKVVMTDASTSNNPDVKAKYEKNKNNKDYVITDTSSGFLQDIKKMSTSILGDPPDSATFIAYSFLDPTLTDKANLVRINPCANPEEDANGVYGAPSVYATMPEGESRFKKLMALDMDAVEDDQINLISELCDKFIVPAGTPCIANQLIRGDAKTKHIGYPTYAEAKKRWVLQCL